MPAPKHKYHSVILPRLSGQSEGVYVQFRDYPIRESDDEPVKRIEIVPDFNMFLLEEIWKHISDFDQFVSNALADFVSLDLRVRDQKITVQIHVDEKKSKREFMRALPDAIIRAFKSERLGR